MLLKCELVVCNRLVDSSGSRKCHATISVGKRKDKLENDIVYFLIHTLKNKQGIKYHVRDNILKLHQKYIEEGKCTIVMKEPPHDLIISKTVPQNLKKFLHVLKLAFKGQDTSVVTNLNNAVPPKLCDLEKPKTTMSIFTQSKYPIREVFPKTLEILIISQCKLQRFDSRILRLTNLKILDLSYNKLSDLCGNLDVLVNLSTVTLTNNLFESVPLSLLTNQLSKTIKQLDMSDNKVKYIPNQLANLKELTLLKLSRNEIEFLPGKIGQLQALNLLSLDNNKIGVLPWSIARLRLNFLDLSGNRFEQFNEDYLKQPLLSDIPTLYELAIRFVMKNRINVVEDLPRFVQQQISNVKFCPCGSPCLNYYIPYVKSFDLCQISSSVSYGQIYSGKALAKIIGYLCSKQCHRKWVDNPNTLFTARTNHIGKIG